MTAKRRPDHQQAAVFSSARRLSRVVFTLVLLFFMKFSATVFARQATPTLSIPTLTITPTQLYIVTKDDLIRWVNESRSKLGYRGLKADPYLMISAQDSAQIMADQAIGHLGGLKDRIPLYGYNNGMEVFATENYMTGPLPLESILANWTDWEHQRIIENPLYCHIGVGIAEGADGTVYYVVQAAYPAFQNSCAYAKPPAGSTPLPGITAVPGGVSAPIVSVSQYIAAVRIATSNAEGQTIHVVKNGQSLWSIAAAYGVNFDDLVRWNHLTESSKLDLDQKLLIPDPATVRDQAIPTAIPTILPTMFPDGKFRHVIQPGETLWSIADLWKVDLESLKLVNGLTDDVSLGVGWRLFIPVTPTATPLPTLTPTLTATADQPATISAMIETAAALTLTPATASSIPETPHDSSKGSQTVRIFVMIGLGLALLACGALVGYSLKRR